MEFEFIDVRSSVDWNEWTHDGSTIENGGVVLATAPSTYVLSSRLEPPGLEAVALDSGTCGNLYVLDSNGEIYTSDRRSAVLKRLPWIRHENDRLGDPRALCITGRTIFVADGGKRDGQDGSICAVSKDRLETVWRNTGSFEEPTGIESDRNGDAVYVIDKGIGSGEGFLARVDGDREATRVVEGLTSPEDIVRDDAGALYVLHHPEEGSEVLRFGADRVAGSDRPAPEDHVWISSRFPDAAAEFEVSDTGERFAPSCIEVLEGRDPRSEGESEDRETELIAAVGPSETDEWALFRYSSEGDGFEKLPSFRRSCSDLLFRRNRADVEGRGLYVIEGLSGDVNLLEERSRYRSNPSGSPLSSAYTATVTTVLDSGSLGTHWHRANVGLSVDEEGTTGRTPPSASSADTPREERPSGRDTQVYLSYFATEAAPHRPSGDGERVPRSPEWRDIAKPDPRDVLLNSAVGRYLWVKLELVGSEYSSPRVESFRAYLPRKSYLRHLPAIYQEDEQGADFLERFLAVFESVFVDIEEEMESVTKYFDPAGMPAGPNDDYLSWLCDWLAVETDETWSESAKREFISEAPKLYKKRGTREGLLEILRIYLDHVDVSDRPRVPVRYRRGTRARKGGQEQGPVVRSDEEKAGRTERGNETERNPDGRQDRLYLLEYPDLDCIDCAVGEDAGDPFRRLLNHPQSFLVLVRPPVSDEQMATIRRTVESEKPAHAVGRAVKLRPWMQLGENSFLGVNSALPTREFTLGASSLSEDAVLRPSTRSSLYAPNRDPDEDSFKS